MFYEDRDRIGSLLDGEDIGKPQRVYSAEEFKNIVFAPSEGKLKLFLEAETGCIKTSPVVKATIKGITERSFAATIETNNTTYILKNLTRITAQTLQATYDFYKQTERLVEAATTAQYSMTRTIDALDQRGERAYSELKICRDQLENAKDKLSSNIESITSTREKTGVYEQGKEYDIKSLGQKIDAGLATNEEIQKYNQHQEQQMKSSMSQVMKDTQEIAVTTAEMVR